MKVKNLLKALENVNPEMDVFCTSNTGEYQYCVVNTAKVSELIIDELNNPEDSEDVTDVFLITEEQ